MNGVEKNIDLLTSSDPVIQHLISEKKKGRSSSELKQELRKKGLTAEEISKLIKEADGQFLEYLTESRSKPKEFKIHPRIKGYALIILGLGVTFLTYSGIIDLGNYFILFYGPILAGFAMLGKRKTSRLDFQKNIFERPFDKLRERK